jgi:hypothetical protein
MIKYEYKVVATELAYERELNELAKDGWELICFSDKTGRYFLKREVGKEPSKRSWWKFL